jgi:hypothetical protein
MNIPPYLEKLLLSNEAEFRTATLGLNGSNFLPCPTGKSLVILEMTIQPFANLVKAEAVNLFEYGETNLQALWQEIKQRTLFQIQICNDKFNQHLTFTNAFSFSPYWSTLGESSVLAAQMNFVEKREGLFIYTDRGMYFNFIYYSPNAAPIQFAADPFSTSFLTRLQAEPKYPITSLGNAAETNFSTFENSSKTLAYYPNQKEQTFSAYTPAAPGQSEGFRLVHDATDDTTIVTGDVAPSSGIPLIGEKTFILPVFNVKYALVNKRSTDKGLY